MRISFGIFLAAISMTAVFCHPFSIPEDEFWTNFKNDFQKNYSTQEEELQRQKIFLGNLQAIEEHNKLYEQGKVTYDLKMNEFGDLSNEEFKNRMTCIKQGPKLLGGNIYKADENEMVANSVDWRTKGAVTEVKNQHQCGGCWAFSATGSLEAAHFLKTGKLVSLSEQNLIDCSTEEGNEGCNGGLMTAAFSYIKRKGGIDTEKSYPYTGKDGICKYKKSKVGATIKSYTNIVHGSESDLQSALAKRGPVSVAIDASGREFQFYHSGIYFSSSCSSEQLDHGVLAVGYGTDSTGDYWIVKNSWGTTWGRNGYILMSRNKENNCGIASMATYPVV